MTVKENQYSGLLFFIYTAPILNPDEDEITKSIVTTCREILSPHLLKMVDEFNKLQIEGYSLNLRCYALRRFIEAFVLCIEEKLSTKEIKLKGRPIRGISDFLSPNNNLITKLSNQDTYKNIINHLDNEIHDNPIWLVNEESFNDQLGILNQLIYLDLEVPFYLDDKDKLIKDFSNYEQFANKDIKNDKKLHNETIEIINKDIPLFDLRCAMVDIINDFYSGIITMPNTKTLRDILLINRNIPESEFSNQDLEKAIEILNNYKWKRTMVSLLLKYEPTIEDFISISRCLTNKN